MPKGNPGVKRGTNAGSRNAWLESFDIGERRYIETRLERYAADMRGYNTPGTRRPDSLAGRVFTCALITGVAHARAGDIRYLICIERAE
jgi:hypothetical protein